MENNLNENFNENPDEDKNDESLNEKNETEEKVIESKRYSIPLEMFEEAYDVFQKKHIYPGKYILSSLLVIVGIANLVNVVMHNGSFLGYMLVMICFALAVISIYNPKKIKKNLMASIRGIENDVYTLDIFYDKLVIGTVVDPVNDDEVQTEEYEEVFGKAERYEEIQKSNVYVNNTLRVTERKNFFLVYIKRSMFYIIPKNVFTDDEISRFAIYFLDRIGKYFVCEADK